MAHQTAMAFLVAELQTGLTLSRIARRARSAEKRERTRTNARKAYDSILRHLPGSNLTRHEAEDFELRLEELRSELELLGERL